MANYKEEHIRNNRRLARQIVGGVALLLAVIGLFTVFGWVVSLLRSVLDDSDRRKAYEDRLFGMVMLDPLAFSDVSSVDPGVFKQAAIWGTVYQVTPTPDRPSSPSWRSTPTLPTCWGRITPWTTAVSAPTYFLISMTRKSRATWCPSPARWRSTRRK